jgi:trimeric autotransporter adhesin
VIENSNEKGSIVFSRSLILVFLVSFVVNGLAQSRTITTYAGPPLPVSGTQALTQAIDFPSSIAPDGFGGFYVASSTQHRVYKVAADGTLTLIAGGGDTLGDGGPATEAQLKNPQGIVLDGAGDLYIADTDNHRIRKVTPDGLITTAAGGGSVGYFGPEGGEGGDGGPATAAQLVYPAGVAVDGAGNLYIADRVNNRVRKVTTDGVIRTIAGSTQFISPNVRTSYGFSGDGGPATAAQLRNPTGVAVDGTGNLYIADRGNYRIRKVSPGGLITTAAGTGMWGFSGDGGPATAAQLSPTGVAVDAAGNLYIADTNNSRVRKVNPDGMITTAAGFRYGGGEGPTTAAQLVYPAGVAVDVAGNLYIADTFNSRVLKVSSEGLMTTAAGAGPPGYGGEVRLASEAEQEFRDGVAVDGLGSLYIADTFNNRVLKVTPRGVITTAVGADQLSGPIGVAVDVVGNLYIADTDNQRVLKVTLGGLITTVAGTGIWGFSGDGGMATAAQFAYPAGVAVDGAGNLYVADTDNHRIRRVTPGGLITTVAGTGTRGFSGDGGPATAAQFAYPAGVAVDGAGNLYIADAYNHRVRKVTPEGLINTVAGGAGGGYRGDGGPATAALLSNPFGVAVDGADNLYIADSVNHRIRKVTLGGLITTAAGVGIGGYGGDGGLATAALINSPTGVAVDGAGNLYIADTGNSRVRRAGNATDLPLVTDIQFDSFNVRIQSSWTATFSGTNLTDQTYFDLRFQRPGGNTDQVALNWQRGTAAPHSVPNGTDAGTWTITGARPHQIETDHTGNFFPVSATITVSP